jgi:hypothetical protein
MKTKKEERMRKYFIDLKNRKGKVKITICVLKQGDRGGYGMAIRSKDDEHNVIDGNRIAFARAVRAIKDRRPCFVNRPEVAEAIWSLKLPDFKKLMFITAGMTSDFAKGDDLWAWDDSMTKFIKEVADVV